MAKKQLSTTEKKKIRERLKTKYRFVVVNEQTFNEEWSLRLSPLNLIWFFGGGAFLLITLTYLLIAFTPLKKLIPGYPSKNEKLNLVQDKIKLNQLETQVNYYEKYIASINAIINDSVVKDSSQLKTKPIKTNTSLKPSEEELAYRQKFESKFIESSTSSVGNKKDIFTLSFIAPVEGKIKSGFKGSASNNGIELAVKENESIKAAAPGTVVFASEQLNEVIILHVGGYTTVYRNVYPANLTPGKSILGAQIIATIKSKAKTLHFEIWYNGKAINPETVLTF